MQLLLPGGARKRSQLGNRRRDQDWPLRHVGLDVVMIGNVAELRNTTGNPIQSEPCFLCALASDPSTKSAQGAEEPPMCGELTWRRACRLGPTFIPWSVSIQV